MNRRLHEKTHFYLRSGHQEMLDFAAQFNVSDSSKWEYRLKLVGFCMLIRRSVLEKTGLLDEQFSPGNFEDDDLSMRILCSGYRIVLCRDTFIHHVGSASFRKEESFYHDLLRKNLIKFEEKWGFSLTYSMGSRSELVSLIDRTQNDEINVLEVGCACGGTLLAILNKFKKASVYGIELNSCAAKISQSFAEVQSCGCEEAVYPSGFFDYIIFADVLEHLQDPWTVLKKYKEFLKPNGVVLASIPNVMHHSVIRNLISGLWNYEEAGLLDKTHLRFFTPATAWDMFTGSGFNDISLNSTFIPVGTSDEKFINKLCSMTSEQLKGNYLTYQMIFKASIKPVSVDEASVTHEPDLEKSQPHQEPIANCSEVLFSHQQKNDKQILFVACVNDEDLYKKHLHHIRSLPVPEGYNVETVAIRNAVSMASAYNSVLSNQAKYKIYLHQDIFIIRQTFLHDIIKTFIENHDFGLLGVIGCKSLPDNGIWWESNNTAGKIIEYRSNTYRTLNLDKSKHTNSFVEAEAIDGVVMATQYDVTWRDDLFKSFHFYDISQSAEFKKSGYNIGIMNQNEPWCIHECGDVFIDNNYLKERDIFIKSYKKCEM